MAKWSSSVLVSKGLNFPSAVFLNNDISVAYAYWRNGNAYVKINGDKEKSLGPGYYPFLCSHHDEEQSSVYVVWERKDEKKGYEVVFANVFGGKPIVLSEEPYSEVPRMAVSNSGTIMVVYQSRQDDQTFIYATKSVDGGKTWSKSKRLSTGIHPSITAGNGADDFHLVWGTSIPEYAIFYRMYGEDGKWGQPEKIASGHKDQVPDIAVNDKGDVAIIWARYDAGRLALTVNGKQIKTPISKKLSFGLWPTITVDYNDMFCFAFQGSVDDVDVDWNAYYRSIKPDLTLTALEPISKLSPSDEQTVGLACNAKWKIAVFTVDGEIRVSQRAA